MPGGLWGRFMIACDVCDEWYHGDCVGVDPVESWEWRRYECPPCRTAAATGARPRRPR